MRAQLPLAAPRAPPLFCMVFVGFGARESWAPFRFRSIVFVGQYLRGLAGGDGRGRLAGGDCRGRLAGVDGDDNLRKVFFFSPGRTTGGDRLKRTCLRSGRLKRRDY